MKTTAADEVYLKSRKEFSQKYGERELWSVMDHWPLYAGINNLSRTLSIYELLKSTLNVPGHIAEFGSWRGANLLFMAKVLKIFNSHGSKQVHCFDSFEGLTAFSPQDYEANKLQGKYKGSLQELTDIIKLYDLWDDIIIHKGLIENTLETFVKEHPATSFSFIYCDTDLYDSTKTILKYLHPRLMKGGMFVFDEWNHDKFPGEGVAANEFLMEFSDYYEPISIQTARQPSLALKKIKM
ncbi:TylF/MycF/NovP-related O-methyltransferase [Bdellovibrio sp. HCB2-146]|uniref:TylF/MycF/NovP-related O-methyltransferase n=1 Tax=Bdellovibrio sp. HCB2-146 TaxID=3394362 RepID=UPI0039BCE2C1